jgi:hypothetical protein
MNQKKKGDAARSKPITAESCSFPLLARYGTYRFMGSFVANEGAKLVH